MEKPRFLYLWFWKDFYYKNISCLIWPRQKWLTKKIPKTWSDKTCLIPLILYEMIVNYVEGEKCFETIVWDSNEKDKENAEMIKTIYEWAKTGRTEWLKQIDDAYPELPKMMFDEKGEVFNDWFNTDKYGTYQEKYSKVNKLEKDFEFIDTTYLKWIVENRFILWT